MSPECEMEPMPEPEGKADILISLVLAHDKDVFLIDQAEYGRPARLRRQDLKKGRNDLGVDQIVQDVSCQEDEARPERVGLVQKVLLHEPELIQGVQNGMAFAFVDPDLFADVRQLQLRLWAFTQAEENPGRLLHRRYNGFVSRFLSVTFRVPHRIRMAERCRPEMW